MASTKGRQRCDDIKAQLDAVSVQIKQAEQAQHAQHDPSQAPPATRQPSPDPSPPPTPHSRSASPSDGVKPPANRQHSHFRSASPAAQLPSSKGPGSKYRSVSPYKAKAESERTRSPDASPGVAAEDHLSKQGHSRSRSHTPVNDALHSRASEDEAQEARQRVKEHSTDVHGKERGGKQHAGATDSLQRQAERSTAGYAKRRKHNSKESEDDPSTDAPDRARPADLHGLKQKRRLLYGQLQEARQQVGDAEFTFRLQS